MRSLVRRGRERRRLLHLALLPRAERQVADVVDNAVIAVQQVDRRFLALQPLAEHKLRAKAQPKESKRVAVVWCARG